MKLLKNLISNSIDKGKSCVSVAKRYGARAVNVDNEG